MASSSAVLFLLVGVFAAGASAATFNIKNNCGMTIWPAGIPVGGGFALGSGASASINVPAGTSSGRIWARTGCSFNGGSGGCQTGDCAGQLSCSLSGKPPATLAEYTLGGAQDFYDISIIDGFNLGMAFSCSTGPGVICRDSSCGPPQAYRKPDDNSAIRACNGNSNYQITFCP